MKKNYENPELRMSLFDAEDIVTASNESTYEADKQNFTINGADGLDTATIKWAF